MRNVKILDSMLTSTNVNCAAFVAGVTVVFVLVFDVDGGPYRSVAPGGKSPPRGARCCFGS